MQQRRRSPIRIVAVDDSAVMRGVFRALFVAASRSRDSGEVAMELCAAVDDGVACLEAVERLRPDLLVLDLEMPRMHGLKVLAELRRSHPALPVIMCSAYTEDGARLTLEALALGARDYVTKPSSRGGGASAVARLAAELLPKVAALAGANCDPRQSTTAPAGVLPSVAARLASSVSIRPEVVVIGVSTGGPVALERVLPNLPTDFPVPVLIAQHMPRLFTGALAERLDRLCPLKVGEAREGTVLAPGTVWLAPGDTHMEIWENRSGVALDEPGRPALCLRTGGEPSFCRPSVDRLFRSAAQVYGSRTLAVVMTGMGADGLAGARAIHDAGGVVLAQDEASSAVWGMPGRVWEAGLVRAPLPLDRIARELIVRVSAPAETARWPPPRSLLRAAGTVDGGYDGVL